MEVSVDVQLETRSYHPGIAQPRSRFIRFRSKCKSVITGIRLQNLTPRILPFKVTQGRWNWHGSIGYPWLSINVLQQPRACLDAVSEKNGDISRKLQIFPTPCMNHPPNGFLLNFWRWWDTKTVMIPPPECQKVWLYVHFYRHILTLGRLTDVTGKTISCSACIV